MMKLFDIFIRLNKFGFELIRGEYELRIPGLGIFLGILIVGSVFVLDILIIYLIYTLICGIFTELRTKEIKKEPVIGIITNKTYEKEHTSYNPACKMFISHSAKYYVEVECDGIPGIFNNQEIFEQYQENDTISLMLVKRFGKNDEIIEQKLELPE